MKVYRRCKEGYEIEKAKAWRTMREWGALQATHN
jgi:hypothetical protein